MKRTRLKLLLAAGLTALGVNFNPQLACAATTSGAMATNETWSGIVTLTGDVTVPTNVTLSILPGTRVECWDKYDDQAGGINTSRIELIVDQGSLNAVGTSNAPILFTSSPNVPPALAGDWQGIRLRNGTNSTQVLRWAVVEFAIDGLRVETGSPTIDQCTYRTNQNSGLYFTSPVTVSDCRAYANRVGFDGESGSTGSILTNCIAYVNGDEGILLNHGGVLSHCVSTNNAGSGIEASLLDASYCLSARNGGNGIYGNGNEQIKVDFCTIIQNKGFGMVCNYGSTAAFNSTIVSNSSSGLRGIGVAINFVIVSNCVVTHNLGYGLDLSQSIFPSSVLSSVIANNGAMGVYGGSQLTLQDCAVLSNTGAGVWFGRPGSGGIVRNRIQGNQIGLEPVGDVNSGNITGILSNTVTLNTQYELYNAGTAAVIATNNYWGEPTTTELSNNVRNLTMIYDSQDDASVGQVILKPYLLTDPFAKPPIVDANTPADQLAAVGGSATFTVAATPLPLTYQWRKGISNLPGQTNDSFTLNPVQPGDAAANYNVIVSNDYGSVTSRLATLTVLIAPAITSQPTNLFLPPGTTAAFHVTATGSAPLGYRWQKEGVNLVNAGRVSGATSPDLTITSIQASDVGNYRVVVTNTVDAVTSLWARLDLPVPPTITTNPATQVVGVGGPAVFTVTATGSTPMNYQWYLNGSVIGGANDASFSIPATTAAWLGSYQVQVWNIAGTNWSATAGLWLDALKMYAGVNVYGPAGSNCVVQYATNLTAPVTWTPLQSVTIVTNPTVIIDYDSPDQPHRFYRTLPQ